MKQLTLNIPDRDYGIIEKCAFVRDQTVEKYALQATRQSATCDLGESIASHLGFEFSSIYDDVWSPDIDQIIKSGVV